MQELTFKNYFKALFVILLGIAASSAVTLVSVNSINMPLPLLSLGVLTGFLASCFIIYPKATMVQTLQISVTGIFYNSLILVSVYYLNMYLNLPQMVMKPEFILNINPVIIAIAFLFSTFTLFVGVKLEETTEETLQEEPEQIEDENREETQEEIEEPQAYHPVEEEIPVPQEIHKFDSQKEEEQEKNEQENLEPLEPMELEDKPESVPLPDSENIIAPVSAADFIPTNIRLVQTSHVKDSEQKGKIGAIGKLLVNNKDIENLIESEGVNNSKMNVVTSLSGEKIYQKFDELKQEFTCIREMALVDSGGFIIANNFEDKQRVQIAGALVSGGYHTLQNYLSQLSLNMPVRIFFETEEANSFILKTKEEILFTIWDKEFQQLEYGPMQEMLDTEDFSTLDIIPYADLIKVEKFAVSDSEGVLVNSLPDAENSQLFAAVSSAIFENIKVFLMNIRLFNLTKIIVFTPQKTMTIVKPADKIASFLTDGEEYPKISEQLLNMEEIQ